MTKHSCHCDAIGGAQAKTGDNRKALERSSGMSATLDAMGSKTRSGHPATSTNNHYQAPSLGYGDDNIKT